MAEGGSSGNAKKSHAGGLANVPYNGYIAELHKDERVLTANENKRRQAESATVSSNTQNITVNVRSPFDVIGELEYLDKKLAWGI